MTTIINSIEQWQALRQQFDPALALGFVPTMGNLHQGHASLLTRSLEENAITVLSIFVNPTQFNDKNDLARYPRTLDEDLALAHALKVDYVLAPKPSEIYPNGYDYKISEQLISQTLEGKCRPGHFDGVLTVVMKLFGLVKPHRAYFGEKDFQQLYLIQEMVKAFFLNIEIIACPTLRRSSGLPLSSRNNLLSESELALADKVATALHQQQCPPHNVTFDYIEQWQNRLHYAVRIGAIRIIDNIELVKKHVSSLESDHQISDNSTVCNTVR